jgi:hypothetical protein
MGSVLKLTKGALAMRKFLDRHAMIRSVAALPAPTSAILGAAAEFEFVTRRAILMVGKSPNAEIRELMRERYSLDDLRLIWWEEVGCGKDARRLTTVVRAWSQVRHSMAIRHRIAHGIQSSIGRDFGSRAVERLLTASCDVYRFAEENGIDLDGRMKVRRRRRRNLREAC